MVTARTFDDMLDRLDRDRPKLPEETRQLGETLLAVNARHERLIDGLLMLAQPENELTGATPLDLAEVAGYVLYWNALSRTSSTNAIRYNVPGGSVAVTTGREAHDEVYLAVTNTGPTIPLYDIERIFEPFQRLPEHRGTGVGLGLSIVRAVARAHDGTVTAVPGSDGGLAVRFTLPGIR